MNRIEGATKTTDNRFLNMYELQAVQRDGTKFPIRWQAVRKQQKI